MKYIHYQVFIALLAGLVGIQAFALAQASVDLRSVPAETLSEQSVKEMLIAHGFYQGILNPKAKGFNNRFGLDEQLKVVADTASNLMWQQGGSPGSIPYAGAAAYIESLNAEKFGGYSDWRLPTLEEAMSLMEPKKSGSLHLSTLFSPQHGKIWTSDFNDARVRQYRQPWRVNFAGGVCYGTFDRYDLTAYVKAVRAMKTP